MKANTYKSLHTLVWGFFFMLISACDKSEPFPTDTGNEQSINRTLTITAFHYYPSFDGLKDTLLPNVTVELYSDSFDRKIRQNPVKVGETNDVGELKMEYLQIGYYYLYAEHAAIQDSIELGINIPEASLNAYDEIIFITN